MPLITSLTAHEIDMLNTRGLFGTVTQRVGIGTKLDNLVNQINNVSIFQNNNVQDGLFAAAPTTASTHADAGAYNFRCNFSTGIVRVNGVSKEFAIQNDFSVKTGTPSPIGSANTDIICTIVAVENAGVVTLSVVCGAAAPAGSVQAATDAQITTAIGHARWVKIATVQMHRSGASTVTQVQNNTVRPVMA